ncbi:MAG: Hsp33 family molecular chaperone HslO, partial [Alkalinema sp. CAN_BIN05]|nr:Hsp33 family molecular chaperone HslO [Alkalinema sp. CAN_BIN05]
TQEARERHGLSYVATAALGRSMAGALLLASSMKQPQARVTLRVKGNGPMKGLYVDAGLNGSVRGYVDDHTIELPLNLEGKLDVGGAIGNVGYLNVMRDIGHGQPHSSTTELISGEIGEDLTYYLATSEQTPSALMLGVFVEEKSVEAAGGLLIQIMPKVSIDEALVSLLESRISGLQSFSTLLRSGKTLPIIFEELLGDLGLDIFPEVQPVRFHCPCNRDRVTAAIPLLGESDLADMISQQETAEATCHFCNETYYVDPIELREILAQIRSGSLAS